MPVFRVSLKVVGIPESYNGVWPPKLLFTQILDHRRPRNFCFWGYVDLYCLPVCCACLALVAEAKKMQSLFSKLQSYVVPIVFFFGKGQSFLRCLRIPKWCLESSALMLSKFIQILLFIMTMCIHGLRFSAELNTFFFFFFWRTFIFNLNMEIVTWTLFLSCHLFSLECQNAKAF